MKTLLNVKTDVEVKRNAKRLAENLGIPLSTIVNAYLKQFVRRKEIHFTIAPHMTPYLEELLGEVEKDVKAKKNVSPAFCSAHDMDRYLDSL